MTRAIESRLTEVLGSPLLASRLGTVAAPFLERRGGDAALQKLDEATLLGVARLVCSSGEASRLLAARPELIERLACASDPRRELAARSTELLAGAVAEGADDLEASLDGLRLLRREETAFVSCLDLGGVVAFGDVSRFLSVLAESILRRSLALAAHSAETGPGLSVIGMGKIGGREFTLHSDLDLLFLYEGGAEDVVHVSKIGQRLVSYLTTMTRTGVAYAVDTRLRPSGNQGVLVTRFDAFDAYQRTEAQLWEHLVLVRARAVAGDVETASHRLGRTRAAVLERIGDPWDGIAEMRARVERERGDEREGRVALKTGPGGLMDVDFLAAGGWLECGGGRPSPALPGNEALLRAVLPAAPLDPLLTAFERLRVIEARARLVSGRALEVIESSGETGDLTAAVLGVPDRAALLAEIGRCRDLIRAHFRRVIAARSIGVLGAL